ncbi:MAG TPA: HEAT repeat domain-containing protein [Thermoanaerobaculia bacterium]|nr:HEAT repeat domain-containing protein [Thermoanaerobaculia bacterium]
MSEKGELPPDTSSEIPRESARAILFQFVVFPLGVVAIGVGIFLLFGMLASERHETRDYVNEIRSGSSHQRWQAAYQLSKSLKRGEALSDPDLQRDVADLYSKSKNDDPKVRRYLSMVLGRMGDRRSTPLLLDGLKDSDTETRIYALLALGELKDASAVPAIVALTRDDESDIRKSAVYALGAIGDAAAIPVLVESMNDPVADVRWNASLALSRFGDRRSLPGLRQMLDRKIVAAAPDVKERQTEETMIAAIAAWARLSGKDGLAELRAIGASDPSMRVRSAAASAIQQVEAAGR